MPEALSINITSLSHAEDLPLPCYATPGAAGMDLMAAFDSPEHSIILEPMAYRAIPTGFKMAIPQGYEAQIRPRSGLAAKHGITVLNSPGTIDSDYRGEVKVLLINLGKTDFVINHGERIAQMIIAPYTIAALNPVNCLDDTARGEDGFGSTGTKP